ncbi:MAG: rhomboid family intramembrane serine protease [Bacteroidetes bacterium]|jgi:membrane associated rhomboid family serine protease|nr:rhomboid family intramembrane serine protease [Bacteroidota bacterium]
MFSLTPIVLNLLILNGLFYMLEIALLNTDAGLIQYFILGKVDLLGIREAVYGFEMPVPFPLHVSESTTVPITFEPYQLVTYFFSHSPDSIMHILFNMLALVFLGPQVERVIGSRRFLQSYLVSGLLGGLFIVFFDPSPAPVLGASGAVSGVMLLFAMIYPDARMILFPIPIPIRAKWLITGLIVISCYFVYSEVRNPGAGGGVSHFGHLMGMLAVFLYVQGIRLYYQLRR